EAAVIRDLAKSNAQRVSAALHELEESCVSLNLSIPRSGRSVQFQVQVSENEASKVKLAGQFAEAQEQIRGLEGTLEVTENRARAAHELSALNAVLTTERDDARSEAAASQDELKSVSEQLNGSAALATDLRAALSEASHRCNVAAEKVEYHVAAEKAALAASEASKRRMQDADAEAASSRAQAKESMDMAAKVQELQNEAMHGFQEKSKEVAGLNQALQETRAELEASRTQVAKAASDATEWEARAQASAEQVLLLTSRADQWEAKADQAKSLAAQSDSQAHGRIKELVRECSQLKAARSATDAKLGQTEVQLQKEQASNMLVVREAEALNKERDQLAEELSSVKQQLSEAAALHRLSEEALHEKKQEVSDERENSAVLRRSVDSCQTNLQNLEQLCASLEKELAHSRTALQAEEERTTVLKNEVSVIHHKLREKGLVEGQNSLLLSLLAEQQQTVDQTRIQRNIAASSEMALRNQLQQYQTWAATSPQQPVLVTNPPGTTAFVYGSPLHVASASALAGHEHALSRPQMSQQPSPVPLSERLSQLGLDMQSSSRMPEASISGGTSPQIFRS
ncbi:hypothetical protein CYMTET_8462, partial [Cymbomonas tetramitiformis]